jgi:KDO2-lipid IV(A) lauroyltransferase
MRPTLLGTAFYTLLPVRRRLVMSNLRRVFGEKADDRELRRVARCFYGHFVRSIGENLVMSCSSERRITSKVDVVGVEHLLEASELGRGILVLTGHFGNWELASVGAMMQFEKYRNRLHVIRKTLAPGIEQIVFSAFHRAGFRIISRSDALTRVLDVLADNDLVIFVMDQHAIVGAKAVAVEFFGEKAGTNRSLALVAGKSKAPVIPAAAHRRPDGRHVMHFHEPLEWIHADDPGEEIYLNTRRYNEVLEGFVLDHPEQWFWFHRRWKLGLHPPSGRARRMKERGREY